MTPLHQLGETPTIGERIDHIAALHGMLRFPKGSASYAEAQTDLLIAMPALKIAMLAETIIEARTRTARADINMDSSDHELMVERIPEVPM